MSNLVPEQRMDKNNRLVTRHVRAHQTSSQTGNALPEPSLQQQPSEALRQALIGDVKELFYALVDSDPERFFQPTGKAEVAIEDYSADFLIRVKDILENGDENSLGFAEQLGEGYTEGRMGKHLNAYQALQHMDGMSYLRAADHALALQEYTHPDVPQSGPAQEELKPEHVAILTVTHAISQMLEDTGDPRNEAYADDGPLNYVYNTINNPVYKLNQDAMIRFTVEHASEADRIAEIITRSGISSASEVQGIYDLLQHNPDDTDRIMETLDTKVADRAAQVEEMVYGHVQTALMDGIL